jgi:hypothetical protein
MFVSLIVYHGLILRPHICYVIDEISYFKLCIIFFFFVCIDVSVKYQWLSLLYKPSECPHTWRLHSHKKENLALYLVYLLQT